SSIPPPPRSTLFPYTTLFRSSNVYRTIAPKAPAFALISPMALHRVYLPGPEALAPGEIEVAGEEARHAARVKRLAVGDPLEVLRSEEHTSELQSPYDLVCRLL